MARYRIYSRLFHELLLHNSVYIWVINQFIILHNLQIPSKYWFFSCKIHNLFFLNSSLTNYWLKQYYWFVRCKASIVINVSIPTFPSGLLVWHRLSTSRVIVIRRLPITVQTLVMSDFDEYVSARNDRLNVTQGCIVPRRY